MRERKVQIPELRNATYNGKPAPGWTTYTIFKCSQCHRIRQSTSAYTTGYGRDMRNCRICFTCCGSNDKRDLISKGKGVLYLSNRDGKYSVINWPGTLRIPVSSYSRGSHNIAGSRLDVWFQLNGQTFHGVNLGDNDILRVRRNVK